MEDKQQQKSEAKHVELHTDLRCRYLGNNVAVQTSIHAPVVGLTATLFVSGLGSSVGSALATTA